MYQKLITVVTALHEIPVAQLQRLTQIFYQQTVPKNNFFIRAGERSNQIGFNVSGLFRYYYTDVSGNEYTKYLCTENSFIISYSAMLLRTESSYSIEALEDSEILVADCIAFNQLFEEHPCWHVFARKMLEEIYIYNEERERSLILDSAETRYLKFLNDYPGLEKRMKQYHIASYLGVNPVTLSKVRNNLNEKENS